MRLSTAQTTLRDLILGQEGDPNFPAEASNTTILNLANAAGAAQKFLTSVGSQMNIQVAEDIQNLDNTRAWVSLIVFLFFCSSFLLLFFCVPKYRWRRSVRCTAPYLLIVAVVIGAVAVSVTLMLGVGVSDLCEASSGYISEALKRDVRDKDVREVLEYYLYCKSNSTGNNNPLQIYVDSTSKALASAEPTLQRIQEYSLNQSMAVQSAVNNVVKR